MVSKWFMILTCISLVEVGEQNSAVCDMLEDYERHEGSDNYVRCQGTFSEAKTLQDALTNITSDIHVFELYNSSLDLLPEDIFRDVKNASVRRFVLSKSSLNLLSVPEYNLPPFHSVENSLESFEVYSSSFVFAWNFSALSSMRQLKTVIIENSEFVVVPDTFKLWPSLKFIQMINCKIRWVHGEAFQKNEKLSICSLANNLIKVVSRSMFPKPALHLWSLDLSYNKLAFLPKDIFEDMHSLKELKLDYNQLKGDGDVYKIVWNNLTQLWLDGNDIICWKLCPLVRSREKERPQFFDSSECRLPGKHKILLDSFSC